ncbi:acyltransferase family protein [Pseudooceanicola sp.]|uniref:acyltransferase family protein n=1 Tax=Pseudooceanicola sp. TaxID=1914328 RepID=UPI00351124D8
MKYREEIDGLRSVAVLPVILFHAGVEFFSGGFVGVDVFFVISGFLITTIIAAELERGTFSLLRFYERRARRILPALFFMMLCTLPFAWLWMLPDQLRDFSQSLVAVITFSSNFLFFFETGYFAADAELKPLLHTWSLAVEEQYYLFFPLLLWLLWRFGRRPAIWVVAALALASLAACEWGWRHSPEANFFLTPFLAWELLAGSLCALYLGEGKPKGRNLPALLGLLLVVVPMVLYDGQTPFPSLFTLAPIVGTALIILFAARHTLVGRLLSLRPLVGIGLISYSAYLWHQPVFAFARLASPQRPDHWVMLALAGLSLVLAYLSWRFVEQPFRGRGGGVLARRSAVFGAAFAGSLAFAGIGVVGHVQDGYPARMPASYWDQSALMDKLFEERLGLIRNDLCHYSEYTSEVRPETFMARWDCDGRGRPGLEATPIAIYGDSHAADRAAAFRAAGIDVIQITGASCPLWPRAFAEADCNILLEFFHSEMRERGIRNIVISNRFSPGEDTPERLQELADYWSARYDRVFLFTPMPEFADFALIYKRFGPEAAARIRPDLAKLDTFRKAAAQVDWKNVEFVDTVALFCGRIEDCNTVTTGPMLVDYGHTSQLGVAHFSQGLSALIGELSRLNDGGPAGL